MEEIRGTIILCEYICRGESQKHILVGTFTRLIAQPGLNELVFPEGLHLYVRFQVEKIKTFNVEILVVNQVLPPTIKPLQRIEFAVPVDDSYPPIEVACKLPPFKVQLPPGPPNEARGMRLKIWLRVDGLDVASTPLDIIFPPLKQEESDDHPLQNPNT